MNQNINKDFIPFALPSIGKEEEEAVISVLRSGWLTTGSVVAEFERSFAEMLNIKYAVALSSATAGLHLSLMALNTKRGDFIITTPYTFASVAEVSCNMNAHPCFIDIEKDTFNMDPFLLEKQIKRKDKNISAIIPVHIGGLPCDMKSILEIAVKSDIPVIEDAAHAFPVNYNGKPAGTLGDAGVFSFYATKTITTGEGGMFVTNNKNIAEKVSILCFHGIDRKVWDRYQIKKSTSWDYNIVEAGCKYNLTNIAAAIGLAQLKKAKAFLKRRTEIAEIYLKEFSESDFLIMPPVSKDHAWHLFIVGIEENKLTVNRDQVINLLTDSGIGVSVHYKPLHLMQYYKKKYGYKPEDFPVSFKKYKRSFSLPIYPDLTDNQVYRIVDTVKQIGKNNFKRNYYAF